MSARQDQSGAEKGPDAFRTISEVAEDLDLPQHVLRFWETRFPQIRPLKRGGGRRYYRPDDVELLRGIRHLLYGEGYTIRGVQRILKEEGLRYVQALARDVDADERAIDARERREEADVPAPPARPAIAPPPDEPPARPVPPAGETSGGALGGILGLLPGRARDPGDEASARRARRRPDSDPDHFDLPLLADLEPPARPARAEPVLRGEPPMPGEGGGDTPIREPRLLDPREPEFPSAEYPEPEPRSTNPRATEPRPSFPFRPIGAGPVTSFPEDEESFVPERARTPHAEDPSSRAMPLVERPAMPEFPAPRADDAPADVPSTRTRLGREDVRRLEAALHELQDCQRLLDAARDRGN